MQDYEQQIARALIEIEAVIFRPLNPVTFKSGIVSPIYVDNRRIPFYPTQWRMVIDAFHHFIQEKNIPFDVIAGIETAGIPHSAALAYAMSKPSVFVRKQTKDHGLKSRIEGGDVTGKRVLLIEDLITTGSSSLSGVEALREAKAAVTDVLAVISYGFAEAREAFAAANVHLHTLTTFKTILDEAVCSGKFNPSDQHIITHWLTDPYNWTER